MKTTISTEDQIGLPTEIRRQDDIEAGQELQMERYDRGETRNHGLADWLLGCPERGFFVPIKSEPTDAL